MKNIFTVAEFSFWQVLRDRFAFVVVIVAVGLLLIGFLVSSLGGEQPARIIFDVNIAGIEFLGMLVAIFLFAGFIYREVEQRTITLTFVRPITRLEYLSGKFLGLYLAVSFLVVAGGVLNILFLILRRSFFSYYWVFLLLALLKIFLVAVVALFFSLLTTSFISSLIISFSFWILGHFTAEINFIAKYSRTVLPRIIARILSLVLPNFSLYNWKELGETFMPLPWGKIIFYTVVYGFVLFAGSYLLFRKKEF